ncbi:ATP-binding sensor histidine kinase [Marinoscillum sp. MHG1-6]|uniref:ATP-binding sensor histidine kinase n=1 Tax=Marinoscillum sp. MHG1-6 TaxID=2959627 RepID=UPI002157BE1B|nr:ATP-binding sensor histidine kinase [Marinoscillum sp. MHG1-6]
MELLKNASKIAEGFNSSIYHLKDSSYNGDVILKVIQEDFNYFPHSTQLINEHRHVQKIKSKGIRKSLDLIKDHQTPILVLEYFDGKTLKDIIRNRRPSFIDALRIAIKVTETLSEIHGVYHVIHRDISAYNILVNDQLETRIIDFGLASNVDIKQTVKGVSDQLEGTLPYISPEQTGRVNQVVDNRSDLYSLGVVLYELFTGQLPFQQTDPLEIIHAHLALRPTTPSAIDPSIPEIFSDIIMRLIAKDVENRYQSAGGLLEDLKKCHDQVALKVEIKAFDLGQNDQSGKFLIPSKLYGRERQKECLINSIENLGQEHKEITLVSGKSGSGKTSLIYEIHKPITEKRGNFIKGKHQQFQKDRPYQAISQAINGLVSLLLSESDKRLNVWKEQIVNALGEQGKLITDLVPNLELIIGKQKELPILGLNEAQNRFTYVFMRFIKALASEQHPLVMFIDDLQWADSASLKLLKTLVCDPEMKHLYFIGAYRDNEVDDSHPLNIIFNDLPGLGIDIVEIKLDDLSFDDTLSLIQDTFSCSEQKGRELNTIVHSKTAGNPFFVNEFLKSIYENELVRFESNTSNKRGEWTWNIEELKATNFTDNVVEFMIEKLKKIHPDTQQLLTLGACIGDRFDLKTLRYINEHSDNIVEYLWQAVIEQLLLVEETSGELMKAVSVSAYDDYLGLEFRFAHDRIRQAAIELIPENEKGAVHQKIGELLLSNINLEKKPEKLFEILDQLNKGIPKSKDKAYQLQLIDLNVKAGKKAMASSAYDLAIDHFESARKLHSDSDWVTDYELSFELFLSEMECHLILGHYTKMEGLGNILLSKSQTQLDTLKAQNIFVQSYIAQSKHHEVINYGLDVLSEVGIKLPKKPNDLHILTALGKTKWVLRSRKAEELENLPEMTDETLSLAIKMISSISTASYHNFPKLFPLGIFKAVQLSLKHGNHVESISFYGGYGTILCGVLGQYDEGYDFGQLSLRLLRQSDKFQTVLPKTLVIQYAFINHWKNPVRDAIAPLQEAYIKSLEIGDNQYAASAVFLKICAEYNCGVSLNQIVNEAIPYLEKMNSLNQESYQLYTKIVFQSILNIHSDLDQPWELEGTEFSLSHFYSDQFKKEFQKDQTALFHINLSLTLIHFLFGNYKEALHHIDEVKRYMEIALSTVYFPIVYFYDTLVRLRQFKYSEKSTQKKWMKIIRGNVKKLVKWAHHSPSNFQHKYDLIQAELAAISNNPDSAITHYQKAITNAEKSEYQNELALSQELYGRFFARKGDHEAESKQLKAALKTYQKWGAKSKVAQLKKEFSYLKEKRNIDLTSTFTSGSLGTMSGSVALDLSSVLKAASTISSEIQLTKAIPSLLNILIENAGAQTGAFILVENGGKERLSIYATCHVGEEASMVDPVLVEEADNIPESIIRYVHRTRERIILDNGPADDRFGNDPYIRKEKVQSALCLPVIHSGNLLGIIYLENRLNKGVFTAERTDLLSMLSGQIAITLNNALLYDTLEQKVKERTREIEQQKNILDRQNVQLTELNNDKDYLISVVSHDLRNPLYLIKGYVDMVMADPQSDEAKEYLKHVLESSNRMEGLITRILDTNAINSGEVNVEYSTFELIAEIQNEIHNHQEKARAKKISLTFNSDIDEVSITSDASHIRQILDNLISNGIKYTQKNGEVAVSIGHGNSEGWVILSVEDNGQGMSRKDQKLLFSKFQTLSSIPTAGEKSTGIGLSIVKRYVESLKGHIRVESEPHNGSKFYVELPLAPQN